MTNDVVHDCVLKVICPHIRWCQHLPHPDLEMPERHFSYVKCLLYMKTQQVYLMRTGDGKAQRKELGRIQSATPNQCSYNMVDQTWF